MADRSAIEWTATDFTPPSKFVLKGIELHLDVLGGYMADGKITATSEEIAVIKKLSERVGGFDAAFQSFGHAISYDKLTRQMMNRLGAFYQSLHETGDVELKEFPG